MPTVFRFALLSAVIAQSLTALANQSCSSKIPEIKDLEVARREMERFPNPVVLKPNEPRDFIYVKDTKLQVWVVNSFVEGEAASGCVRRAWKAAVEVPPAETPQFEVKIFEIHSSNSLTQYKNEIAVLEALKREPSTVLVRKEGKEETPDTKGVVHSGIQLRTGDEMAEAYIFQLLNKGTKANLLKIFYNSAAIANIQEGARRELKELHSKGWYHGNARLSNFLADETGIPDQYNVKIVNFGNSVEGKDDVSGDFFYLDKYFLFQLKEDQFDIPFAEYYNNVDSGNKWKPDSEVEEAFGHVENWQIKLDHLVAIKNAIRRQDDKIERIPYYKSLLKQIMSPRVLYDDVSSDAPTVRLLEDTELAKSSLETELPGLKRTNILRLIKKTEKYVEFLSQEIAELEASLGKVGAAKENKLQGKKEVPSFGSGASDNLDAQVIPGKITVPAKAPAEASTDAVVSPKRLPAPSTSDQTGKVPDHAQGDATHDESSKLSRSKEGSDHVPANAQPNSSSSFSGSLLETMSVAAATTLACFALATFSV